MARSPMIVLMAVVALLAVAEPSMFVEAKPKWLQKVGDALNKVKGKGKGGGKKKAEAAGECDNSAAKVPKGGAADAEPAEPVEEAPKAKAPKVDYPAGAAPLLEAATANFGKSFGGTPALAAHAPGRVNLIGEHTDYTGGFVLPLALEKRTVVVATGKVVDVEDEAMCSVGSIGMEDESGNLEIVSFDANPDLLVPGMPQPFWTNYVKGVVKQYAGDLPAGKKFVFQAVFASDVPLGAGLSSSAALEVATATLLEMISGVVPPNPATKALRCQKAEHEFCDMPCGIMDQFISAMGQDGHVLKIDCRSQVGSPVPMNANEVVVLIANSKVKHELSGSEYPDRVAQCKAATEVLAESFPEVKELRDATMEMLESVKEGLDEVAYRRAMHVISENTRVEGAEVALKAGQFEELGKLMVASHNSLRDDFEVSTPELDTLVELAVGFEGVMGSRMTGGGFGGCTVTVVKKAQADALAAHIKKGYKEATGVECDIFVTRPGPGAGPLEL